MMPSNHPMSTVCQPTTGSFPCGLNQTRCWSYDQACDGNNDCGDELAFDEIPGFVERFGVACAVNETRRGDECKLM